MTDPKQGFIAVTIDDILKLVVAAGSALGTFRGMLEEMVEDDHDEEAGKRQILRELIAQLEKAILPFDKTIEERETKQ